MQLFSFFHLYGLLVGIGIVIVLWCTEKRILNCGVSENFFWRATTWTIVGCLIGARLYHVSTDWWLYQSHVENIIKIWQGGLSIIGAVLGGTVALLLFIWFSKKPLTLFWTFADTVVFGLPFGQAVGRLGNYVNQELYGLPTHLPWGIFIDIQHRFPAHINQEKYHPLFLYEAIPVILFGLLLWKFFGGAKGQRHTFWEIGRGRIFVLYLGFYSLLRFGLDFLRIDKPQVFWYLGFNQIFLLTVGLLSMSFLFYQIAEEKRKVK